MGKRRKVGNPLALGVLSALAFRQMHPYEIASALKGWGKDRDLKIKWGSLYTVVGNLAKHDLIAEVESVRAGRRPERTIYRLTAAGRAELLDWTRELLSTAEPEAPLFRGGLSVMSVLSPDEVVTLLQQRLKAVEREIEATYSDENVPRLFLIEVEYDRAMRTAEATWMRSLITELRAGTFAGLEEWRVYHETGRPPEEIRRLAEETGPGDLLQQDAGT
ncbi:PadR family transcriptional regulator [Paractinoplanes ferrugineus]|uniref:PadR family transcriptional regulator n=1 Tax=Paractinoplanes ferrugineus TaxID=113564 RepID=A0A919MEZ7_9ACTN|nr:PadR family transcriptional regulator [Actinoplanes ferrugineus]GIE12229.1 PadR family transcriptional regulator [Actinoplanes ferrugineus]